MWIKICANTNLEDAVLAAELGADALGFVFARSKRQVSAQQVAAITRALPDDVERIGVLIRMTRRRSPWWYRRRDFPPRSCIAATTKL